MFENSEKPIEELIENLPTLEAPDIDVIKAKTEILNSPIYRQLIISEDGRTTALLLSLKEDPKYNQLLKTRNKVTLTQVQYVNWRKIFDAFGKRRPKKLINA